MLAASAHATRSHAHEAMFGVAGAALLLLFVGTHNAWDLLPTTSLLRGADERRMRASLSRPTQLQSVLSLR